MKVCLEEELHTGAAVVIVVNRKTVVIVVGAASPSRMVVVPQYLIYAVDGTRFRNRAALGRCANDPFGVHGS